LPIRVLKKIGVTLFYLFLFVCKLQSQMWQYFRHQLRVILELL